LFLLELLSQLKQKLSNIQTHLFKYIVEREKNTNLPSVSMALVPTLEKCFSIPKFFILFPFS
jgi:hypothetical protein